MRNKLYEIIFYLCSKKMELMKQNHLLKIGLVIFLKGATFSDFVDYRLLNYITSGIQICIPLFWGKLFQLGSSLIKQWASSIQFSKESGKKQRDQRLWKNFEGTKAPQKYESTFLHAYVLNKLWYKLVTHIFTLLLAPFESKFVNFSRQSESLKYVWKSTIGCLRRKMLSMSEFFRIIKDSLCPLCRK